MSVTLAATSPVPAQGSVDWQQLNRSDACEIKLANYNNFALIVAIGPDLHWLLPWSADVFPVYCLNSLRFTQVAIPTAQAPPAGVNTSLLAEVAFGEERIPGIYPLPLYSILPLDGNAADIKDLVGGDAAAVAGALGLAADAGHQHPMRTEGAAAEASRAVVNVRGGVIAGTPRVLWDDGTNVWEVDITSNVWRIFTPGSVKVTVDSTGHLKATNYVGPTSSETGHSHAHNHGAHNHTEAQHVHLEGTVISNTGPASAGTAHTHAYNDAGAQNTFLGGTSPTDNTTPATDSTGTSGHTHIA